MANTIDAAPRSPAQDTSRHCRTPQRKGGQQQEDRSGPGHKGEKHHNGQSREKNRRELPWEGEQPKQEKDQNLRQARKSVEKVDQGRLMGNFGVSDQDARQIGPQVAVPPHHGGQGKGEQGRSHHENSIQPVGESEPAEHQNGQPRHRRPKAQSKDNLRKNHPRDCPAAAHPHQGEGDHRQHIGGRVVAAALHLQQGGGVVPQAQLLGAEDGKHRRGVRGTDNRPGQKALQSRKTQCQVAEQRCEQRGDRHAQGGQHHRRAAAGRAASQRVPKPP